MLTKRVARCSTFLVLLFRFYPNAAERTFATASVYTPPECFLSATTTHQNRNGTFELILAGDYDELDGPVLTNSIDALKQRGAHRCWHKHSTFLEHLVGVHNILRLWSQGATFPNLSRFSHGQFALLIFISRFRSASSPIVLN